MVYQRYTHLHIKQDRETVFIKDIGYPKGSFTEDIRVFANGLMNAHGGVIYVGVQPDGLMIGKNISRKEEDEYRLAVDHIFGSFQPFVSADKYRLSFISLSDPGSICRIIELKVSVAEVGEIHEDGCSRVFLVDSGILVGKLHPQELKEVILVKYKESLEGAEEAARYATPNLDRARSNAKRVEDDKKTKLLATQKKLDRIVEEEPSVATRSSEPVPTARNIEVNTRPTVNQVTNDLRKANPHHSRMNARPLVDYDSSFF